MKPYFNPNDSIEVNLLLHQAIDDVVSDRYPVSISEVATLRAQVTLGKFSWDTNLTDYMYVNNNCCNELECGKTIIVGTHFKPRTQFHGNEVWNNRSAIQQSNIIWSNTTQAEYFTCSQHGKSLIQTYVNTLHHYCAMLWLIWTSFDFGSLGFSILMRKPTNTSTRASLVSIIMSHSLASYCI